MVNYHVSGTERAKGFVNIITYIIMQIVGSTAVILIGKHFNTGFTIQDIITKYGMLLLIFPLLLVLAIIIPLNISELYNLQLKKLKDAKTYIVPLIGLISYIFLMAFVSIAIKKFAPHLNETSNQDALNASFKNVNIIYIILGAVILAPLTEELVFRYSIVNLFSTNNKFFRWFPYLMSAILFTSIHEYAIYSVVNLTNVFHFALYFIPALVLVFVYAFSNRCIFSSIFLHMTINSIALLGLVR